MNQTNKIMRYKILMIMMLMSGTCFAQGVYKCENVEITGSSYDGPVTADKYGFTYTDSIVSISIDFYEVSPSMISISNKTGHAIKLLWRDFMAYSDNDGYIARISSSMIDDKRGGEQSIYGRGSKTLIISPKWSNIRDMFSKKEPNKGTIAFTIVGNEMSHDYFFNFKSKIVR